jgi:hypothetical protein
MLYGFHENNPLKPLCAVCARAARTPLRRI